MLQKGCINLIREWPPFTLSVINTNTLMILVQHTLFQRTLAVFEILMSKTHHRETRKYWAVCCHNNDHIVVPVTSNAYYAWPIGDVCSLSSPFSSPPFPLFSLLFSFPFSLFLPLFLFPFLFSFSLFFLPFPLFSSFPSFFFPFPLFPLPELNLLYK